MIKSKKEKAFKLYLKRHKKVLKKRRKKNFKGAIKTESILSHSQELDFLKKENFIIKTHYFKDKATVKIPKDFSLTLNPNETLLALKKLVHICNKRSINKVYIDHSDCTTVDIAASTIMDTIIMQMQHIRNKTKNPIEFSGAFPCNNSKLEALLLASGILKHLGFKNYKNLSEKIITLDLQQGSNEISGNVSTEITKYFIKCLHANHLTLEDDGVSYLSGFIGEVMDNCTTHAGVDFLGNNTKFLKWYALGHYHHFNEGHGEFHLVLYNYGKTIYQGLKDTSDKYICNILEKLTLKRMNDIKMGKTTEETLWTLYALQEGISRLKHEDETRGTGTVDLLETFKTISGNRNGDEPVMSITSGKAHLLFNNVYSMGDDEYNVLKNTTKNQVIAFNSSNDLNLSPDYQYVKTLEHSFPGTVIAMRFPLDKKYIEKIRSE